MKKPLSLAMVCLLLAVSAFTFIACGTRTDDGSDGSNHGRLVEISYDASTGAHYYSTKGYMQERQSKIVQLTPEQLSLPTGELVDLILDFPFWTEYFSSTYPYAKTYEIITTAYEYNGFAELEKRPDSSNAMLCRFKELVKESDYGSLHASYLYFILSTPVYYDRLTPEELAEFECVCDEYNTAHTRHDNVSNENGF
ncbi:MAG: hypothetical protein J5530_04390 [Clostridia bacterium]|nr:hypothetical protein [Clostridia bacterium]